MPSTRFIVSGAPLVQYQEEQKTDKGRQAREQRADSGKEDMTGAEDAQAAGADKVSGESSRK